ncbi:MAG: ATP-binding cassette domain-containing protein [Stackebrandtia sp.]
MTRPDETAEGGGPEATDETSANPPARRVWRPPPRDAQPPPLEGFASPPETVAPTSPPVADAEMPPYLVATGLSAVGPEGPVFTDVSLSADRGDLVVVVGDSGTGRTSLLLALVGRFVCSSGAVLLRGRREPRFIRERTAVARAAPAVVVDDSHTVADLIAETTLTGPAVESDVRAACELTGAPTDSAAVFGLLPRVDKTLLLLAFAAARRTPVVALDDADAGVDHTGVARIWTAMRRLTAEDRVVLAVASRMEVDADVVVRPRPIDHKELS